MLQWGMQVPYKVQSDFQTYNQPHNQQYRSQIKYKPQQHHKLYEPQKLYRHNDQKDINEPHEPHELYEPYEHYEHYEPYPQELYKPYESHELYKPSSRLNISQHLSHANSNFNSVITSHFEMVQKQYRLIITMLIIVIMFVVIGFAFCLGKNSNRPIPIHYMYAQ